LATVYLYHLQLIAASTVVWMLPDGIHPDTSWWTCIQWDNPNLGYSSSEYPPKKPHLPRISRRCWRCLAAYQEVQSV